jgi:diguanylate cyclase (GGDEF)-like protein/PAS domain S-box-containing protein
VSSDLGIYQFLVENGSDGVYFVDHDRTITGWNRGARAITGFSAEQVVGRRCQDEILNHVDDAGRQLCTGTCPLTATMADGRPRSVRVWMNRADGSRLPVWVRAIATREADGTITGAMEVFTDDSSTLNLRARTEALRQTTMVDALTGLGNQHYLTAQLTNFCAMRTGYGWPTGVLAVDIDDLSNIDGDHGRGAADRAVTLVARTLSQTVPDMAVVGRCGERRFVVLQPCRDIQDLTETAALVRRMILTSRLVVGQHRVPLTISVAGSMITGTDGASAVLHRAASLLHRARDAGRNQLVMDDQD